jgi:hypothetical protein
LLVISTHFPTQPPTKRRHDSLDGSARLLLTRSLGRSERGRLDWFMFDGYGAFQQSSLSPAMVRPFDRFEAPAGWSLAGRSLVDSRDCKGF